MIVDENSSHDIMSQRNSDELLAKLRALEEEVAVLREKVPDNVVSAPFAGEAPRYQLNEAVFLDDTLFEPTMKDASGHLVTTELEFHGTPNLSMVPLNEPAKRKMQEFIDYLTECQRERDTAVGRQFTGLITDKGVMLAQANQDARRGMAAPIAMPAIKGSVPTMTHTQEAQQQAKRRGRPPGAKNVGKRAEAPGKTANAGGGFVGPGQEPAIFREAG